MSPYTIQQGEHSDQVLTPILLDGANYEQWSKLMVNVLRTKRKLGFLDGTLKRPENGTDGVERWDMVNSMMIGWLYASVEPQLHSVISLVDDVSVMWASIKNWFSVSDGTREHQLHEDIQKCKQDGQTVEDYYGKLMVLWDALANLDKGFTCCCKKTSCASMVEYNKKRDGVRIHQFLMGLDSQQFRTTRSNLLARLTGLNLDQ
ncbi:hypothetical protein EUTSA_v10019629mg, partial [Eutrema salsugineum]